MDDLGTKCWLSIVFQFLGDLHKTTEEVQAVAALQTTITDKNNIFVNFLSNGIEFKEAGLMLHYTEEMQIINSPQYQKTAYTSRSSCGKGTSTQM